MSRKIKYLNEPILVQLVEALYRRIGIDLEKMLRKEIDNSLLLIKSLNVVKEIVKVRGYLSDKPFLTEKIWEINEILKHANQIEFEDDIMEILTGILEQKEVFDEKEMALLPYIEIIFQKYKYVYNVLFRVINLFVLNCPLTKEDGVTMRLLKLCVLGLNPTYEKKQNEDIGEALLLLQLMISRTRKLLSVPTLTEITVAVKNVITSTKSNHVRARALNVLVQMYPILDTREAFPLVAAKQEDFGSYDRTVLIVALCNIMMEESNPAIIAQIISIAVSHLMLDSAKVR